MEYEQVKKSLEEALHNTTTLETQIKHLKFVMQNESYIEKVKTEDLETQMKTLNAENESSKKKVILFV